MATREPTLKCGICGAFTPLSGDMAIFMRPAVHVWLCTPCGDALFKMAKALGASLKSAK